MKSSLLFLLILSAAFDLAAYDEPCLPSLEVPVQLEPQSLEAGIQHRFYRVPAADFPDDFIASAFGKIGLRYVPLQNAALGASYLFMPKEFDLHAGYAIAVPQIQIRAQPVIHWFGAQSDDYSHWNRNVLYQIALQSMPLFKTCSIAIDALYDNLAKKAGFGTGANVSLSESVSFVGEYYPVIGKQDTTFTGITKTNCFSFGIKFTTSGHHFVLLASNSTDMGMRHLIRGAPSNSLSFGFNIHRLFSW